jgi:polysaccharide pyruvyl transferase WcaK-like protein
MRAAFRVLAAPWSEAARRVASRMSRRRDFSPVISVPHDARQDRPEAWRHVLITGWYGTETAGDKAILGGVLHFLEHESPGCRVTMTTLNRKVSEQTARELDGLSGVQLVDLAESGRARLIRSVDAVVVGGGPLEEIPETEHIRDAFVAADEQRKARVLFGCGIGPLHTDQVRRHVSDICRLTTSGFLRDAESLILARRLGADGRLTSACDPALGYLLRWVA